MMRNNPILLLRRRQLRRSQTDAEKLLWSRLRNKQMHGLKLYRQYSVGTYILDFYCPMRKLAVEIDGGQHMEALQAEHDQKRSLYLSNIGIHVMRFWNNEVLKNIDGVCERILDVLITPPNLPLS